MPSNYDKGNEQMTMPLYGMQHNEAFDQYQIDKNTKSIVNLFLQITMPMP